MNTRYLPVLAVLVLLCVPLVTAQISVQFMGMTPGIAGRTRAQLTYDIVNMDSANNLQVYLRCSPPEGVVVSSSFGNETEGTQHQYVSPASTLKVGQSPETRSEE